MNYSNINVLLCRKKYDIPKHSAQINTACLHEQPSSENSSWIDLVSAFFKPKPRRLQMGISCVFFKSKMWKLSLLPGVRLTHTASDGLVSEGPPSRFPAFPLPRCYRDDVSIVVNPLTTVNCKTVMLQVTGVCRSHHLVRVSLCYMLLAQQSECTQRFAENRLSPCQYSLLKLDGNIRPLWFPWYNLASGSLLCLCESATTFTCTKKCDCNVIIKMKDKKKHSCSLWLLFNCSFLCFWICALTTVLQTH